MEYLTYVLLLTRSSLDLPLELTRFDVGSVDITLGAVLNVIVVAIAGFAVGFRRGSALPLIVWFPFLSIALCSISYAPDKIAGARLFMTFLSYVALFAIPFFVTPSFRSRGLFIYAVIWASVGPAVFGVVEYAALLDASGRIKSTFPHPNIFAFYLVNTITVILFALTSRCITLARSTRTLLVIYVAVLLVLLILTQTRAAWLGCFVVLTTYTAMVDRRYLIVLLFLPLVLFVPTVSERLDSLGTGTAYVPGESLNSYAWRQVLWDHAFEDVQDEIMLGKGLSSFRTNSPKFFPLEEDSRDAHSGYVQAIYETGLVGLVCYMFIHLTTLVLGWRCGGIDRPGSLVVMSGIVAHMLANYSDNVPYYLSYNWYYWGFIGTVFSLWKYWAHDRATKRNHPNSTKVSARKGRASYAVG
jgi:O-antigen ligase